MRSEGELRKRHVGRSRALRANVTRRREKGRDRNSKRARSVLPFPSFRSQTITSRFSNMSPSSSLPSTSQGPLRGSCFCTSTTYALHLIDNQTTPLSSNLTLSAYCHCSGCQRMNGAPFIHTTHWKEGALVWGDLKPARFLQKEGKWKLSCEKCRSPLGTWNEEKKE